MTGPQTPTLRGTTTQNDTARTTIPCPFQDTSEGTEKGFTRYGDRCDTTELDPSPLYPLQLGRKDVRSYEEKNNNTMLGHDAREWTNGIDNTSVKTTTY